ncbi:unnamed protein product [Rotaria sp. Silwood1]|nr:unnamed protein product [Rotaria sp. Silwood1]CAF1346326.1 unnamed protein product [Rotaria sp. Silwood1]CAF1645987.1 unnamed protein product [Rotaria sp. Silwood1]CAF1646051.1 unnamed protein product [Rotaria sp. Silwood1]
MNQFKRKLSSDDLSEKKTTKKLRNEFDQFMTCFEDLSNKLLFEIFDYLDGYGLYEAFLNLNSRFEQLYSSSVLFKSRCCLIQLDEVFNIFKQFSKRWYDDTEDNIINHYVKHSTFTNLTFECIPSSMFEEVIPKEIERVLTISNIYHLEIPAKKVSIPALIQAVNLLPNITTLKVHSLSTDETTELTLKQLLILCSIKETSKITKVYLEEIDDVKELDFLFTFCPCMDYFKVRCINTMDVQSFLPTIFKKIKQNNNHHLRSLCFPVQTVDEQIVKNIERMINGEKPLSNFRVKRILDTVYLRWK